ncbi:MAG: AraC family transcriptional regulator, partial [Prevotella sp.]|nr:AraC family transcriptional regulator [Prevotella sp.]
RFNELDAWLIAAKRKITVLKEGDGEYLSPNGQTDIIPIAHRIIDRLADYEQHPDDYRDGTYREPSDEDRLGYIDFYRAQAYGYMAEAFARNGESQKAHECLEKFEQSAYGKTLDGRKMIAPTWVLLGETEKMEAMYEDLTTARFRDYEQRMEIERQKAEASLWHIIAWLVAVIALLVACFAVYYFLRHREETRKNRFLARQITEIVKLKAHQEAHPSPPLEGLGEADLFRFLSQTIVREKLYLDAAFDRQAAIDYFHLSKERIGAAFAQGSDYASISDFINECRLEYAVNLLNDQPALPVSQVAQASGFSDANYFGRKFKARFGLSPTQFRQIHS